MLAVTGLTFVIQILIIQFAGAFFGTIPLPLDLWLKLFAVSSSVVVVSELVKLGLWIAEKNKRK
jgi:Ca2+-transporting ATPase